MSMEALAIALILLVALLFSPLGLGGGVLYVPILHYVAGWTLVESLLASLTLVWMVAMSSSLAHHQEKHVDVIVAKAGRISAVPAAVLGTILAWLIIEHVSEMLLKAIAATILLFVIERNLSSSEKISGSKEYLGKYRLGAAGGGLASGLLGIGGGAIYVTLNRRLAGLDMRTAAGTSYLIGAAVAPVAIVSHIFINGSLPKLLESSGTTLAIVLPIAAFATAFFGAKTAIKYLPTKTIRITFLVAVSLSVVRYLWDILGSIS